MRLTSHSFSNLLLRPLRQSGSFVLFNYLLLLFVMLPAYWRNAVATKMSLFSFAEAFADLYLLACFLLCLPNRWRRVAQSVLTLVNLTTVAADCFVRIHFHTFINSAMLRLMLETNSNEAGSFLSTYIFQPTTLLFLLPFIGWGIAWTYYASPRSLRFRQTLAGRIPTRFRAPLLATVLLVGWGTTLNAKLRTWKVMSQPNLSELELTYGDAESLSLYSSFHRVAFSLRAAQLANRRIVVLRHTHQHLQATARPDAVPTVVLIIGESFNRTHSSLYGYPLPVTPHQQLRADRGEMFVFTDVVSCWNLTSYVFQHLFSMYSTDSPRPWETYPLFPALFRQAGYHSTFLSNQFPQTVSVSLSAIAGSFFLNDQILSAQLFDRRNTTITKRHVDDDLLAMYDTMQVSAPRRLVIFSLYGMHFNYDERIPDASWNHFDERNYRNKKLPLESREILANYDNATRYNDRVVDQIIRRFEHDDAVVIYCPDHGEELFDGTGVSGRTYPVSLSRAEMHNQFEVPFWIWCSSTFRERRPHEVQRLQAAQSLPFMTDDLPHLLLDLTGILTPSFDATRSPLSPQYNARRKRILRRREEYVR